MVRLADLGREIYGCGVKILAHTDAGYADFVKTLSRRAIPSVQERDYVGQIIAEVDRDGDAALVKFARDFDKAEIKPDQLRVSDQEIQAAREAASDETKAAIAASKKNIVQFAEASMRQNWQTTNDQGVEMGERFDPFQRVGIYIPGGKAPLVSTALMTGAFASAAKVPEIVAMTPPGPNGEINADLLYALSEAGATEIYRAGGAQAIAALAFGTETIKPVDKIFGPGNRFVVEAKRQVVGAVSIDLLPGPSEVLVMADESGDAEFLAADLLAQAEHGPDSVCGFLTTSETLLNAVEAEIEKQLADLPRADIAKKSLSEAGFSLLVTNLEEAIEICNAWAPEHLVLAVKDEDAVLPKIVTAGAIYVGNFSAVAVGDFLAGPSHTLPTGGAGRSFSGLRADQFQRRTSVVRMDQKALQASQKIVEHYAEMEGLAGHGRSVSLRGNR